MFFNFRDLNSHGYEIIGVKTYGRDTCHHYAKHFADKLAMVVFSEIHQHEVGVFFFKNADQYKKYIKGVITLTTSGQSGKTASGHEIDNTPIYVPVNLKHSKITSRKSLVEILKKAEALVETYQIPN